MKTKHNTIFDIILNLIFITPAKGTLQTTIQWANNTTNKGTGPSKPVRTTSERALRPDGITYKH